MLEVHLNINHIYLVVSQEIYSVMTGTHTCHDCMCNEEVTWCMRVV